MESGKKIKKIKIKGLEVRFEMVHFSHLFFSFFNLRDNWKPY